MDIPVDNSNRSLRPLLRAAGVGDGAKVLGTDDGMKFWPTCVTQTEFIRLLSVKRVETTLASICVIFQTTATGCLHVDRTSCVHRINIFIYNINYMNINIHLNTCKYFQNTYCMGVYLCVYIINIHRTHIYYANKNFYFVCD